MVWIQHRCRELSIGFVRELCAFDGIYWDLVHQAWGGGFLFIVSPGAIISSCADEKKLFVFRLVRLVK